MSRQLLNCSGEGSNGGDTEENDSCISKGYELDNECKRGTAVKTCKDNQCYCYSTYI